MWLSLKRQWSIYSVFIEYVPKFWLAFRGWVWMSWITDSISMLIFFFFWKAVYANTTEVNGVGYLRLISYILFARSIQLNTGNQVAFIGYSIREGTIINELLRPVDLQLRLYLEGIGTQVVSLLTNIPLILLAFILGAVLPTDPLTWVAFVITFVIGHAIAFCVNWIIACLTFYTTEIWGVMVLIYSIFQFLSGDLIPLNIMPQWLQNICYALPFAQTRYVPIALMSGNIPVSEALGRISVQLLWLVGMWVFSRWLFSRAVRVVTVQGG